MNYIIGAGGFAKELAWLFNDVCAFSKSETKLTAFVVNDDSAEAGMNILGIPIIRESEFSALTDNQKPNIYVGVGDADLRRKIVDDHKNKFPNHLFPYLIHPSVIFDTRPGAIEISEGVIICAGTILTTNIIIGPFTHINLNCTIGHDCDISGFCTLSPGVQISGNVKIGENCLIGTNASINERITVSKYCKIGSGATVVRNIASSGTYVGTPARNIQLK